MSDSPASRTPFFRLLDGAVSRIVQEIVAPQPLPAQELELALRQFSAIRARTLDLAAPLTSEQAAFQPSRGSWSVAEILDHLLLTEQTYRVQLQRLIDLARTGNGVTAVQLSLQEMNASIAPIPRDFIPYFEKPLLLVNSFLPHAVRESLIRFPVIPAFNPAISDPERRDIAQLRPALVASLDESKALFDGELPPRLMEMTMTHPILGSNNVVKIFRLMSAHEERHHGQIGKVLATPGFPPSGSPVSGS